MGEDARRRRRAVRERLLPPRQQRHRRVPGNPWFICTLWLADYFITRAKTPAELKLALPIFEWTASHALESGVLAEQVNPYTNEPISRQPADVEPRDGRQHGDQVPGEARAAADVRRRCHQPVFRLRRRGPVEVKSQAQFDRLDADFEHRRGARDGQRRSASSRRQDPRRRQTRCKATLAIDTRDCIGCDVCVAHCDKGVLQMVDGKALIDLRHLNQCDLDGTCVEVCPTDVVSLLIQPTESAAPLAAVAKPEGANGNGHAIGNGNGDADAVHVKTTP